MEACASAPSLGRLAARLGHRVLIMSPRKVAPYMHRNKNDVNDADGIAEASSRPGIRFVGLKSVNQQYIQQMHRARQMAVKGRTAHTDQLHGFLLEYGIEAPQRGWARCSGVSRMCWRTPGTNFPSRDARCYANWAMNSVG